MDHCWAMFRGKLGLRQRDGPPSWKVPSNQRLEDLVKCLKNSSISVQDSDKSSWPLGFQVEHPLPAHPSCQLGEQNGSSWKSDSTVPSPGTGDREQNTELQSACCLIKSMHCVQR